jgi:alpha-D-ribose 1-methylphosphonate 5-triphosphate synthase subunit PhnH
VLVSAIQPAFRDPPKDSQRVFRTVMSAMARPGTILPLEPEFTTPAPLGASAAAVLLTLADFETPLWLDAVAASEPAVTAFLRFHTGARLVSDPHEAAFALIAEPAQAPPLAAFAQGLPDYPDRSTTVVYQVETLTLAGWRFVGPGIKQDIAVRAEPLPANFAGQLAANRAGFPLGVDLIYAAPRAMAALPRSAQLLEAR